MKDLLYFNSMITPKIITFVFWLLLVGFAIVGLMMMVTGVSAMQYSFMAGLGGLFGGPLVMVGGALVARIYCEIMIVLFKINEALQDIRNKP